MNISYKSLTVSLGAVALACAATTASADTVDVKYNSAQWGSVASTIHDHNQSPYSINTNAGAFNMAISNPAPPPGILSGSSIIAWCVELTEFLDTSDTVKYTVSYATQDWAGVVTRLFNAFYDDVVAAGTNVMSAAMQYAIWELVTDGNNWNVSNVDGVGFHVSSTGTGVNAAKTQADAWLTDLKNDSDLGATGKYRVVSLTHEGAPGTQDLITISEVPLPGAALMFLSALGIGGLARRKSAAAQPAEALAA